MLEVKVREKSWVTDEASCTGFYVVAMPVREDKRGNNNELGLVPVGLTDQGVEWGWWLVFLQRILLLFMIQVFLRGHQVLLVSVPATCLHTSIFDVWYVASSSDVITSSVSQQEFCVLEGNLEGIISFPKQQQANENHLHKELALDKC